MEYPGGTPRVLTTLPRRNNGVPRWSRDGQWIYFYSSPEKGSYQLWKIPFNGGNPKPVETGEGESTSMSRPMGTSCITPNGENRDSGECLLTVGRKPEL